MSVKDSGVDMVSGKSAAVAAPLATELFEETENIPRAVSNGETKAAGGQDKQEEPQKIFEQKENSTKQSTMEEDDDARSYHHRPSGLVYGNVSPSDFLPPMAPVAAQQAQTTHHPIIQTVLRRSTSHNTPVQQAHHHFHPRQQAAVQPSVGNAVQQQAAQTFCSPVDRNITMPGTGTGVFPSPAPVNRLVANASGQWGIQGAGFGPSSATSPEQNSLDTAAAVAALLDLTPSVHGNEPNRGVAHNFAPPPSSVSNSPRTKPELPPTMPPPPAVPAASVAVSANVVPAPPAAAYHDMSAYMTIASIDLASRSRQLLFDVPLTEKPCKCKNTHCLKLYCTCFQTGSFCDPNVCTCKDCENVEEHNGPSDSRPSAITQILKRRIDAFEPRLKKKTGEGCACKRSRCVMKYCDCFAIGAVCTSTCTCTKCENSPTVFKAKSAGAKHKSKRKQG